ncbi:MAG: hypothetical protein AAF488_19240 [Planctomycetota bacterium]
MQFGHYLIDQDLVTPKQLVDALERQRRDQIPIGELAIAQGYLTYRDVARVLELRVDDRQSDFFGDVAVEFGLLSRAQVDELLLAQRETRRPVGEFLVEAGVIDASAMHSHLHEFRNCVV